MTCHRFLNHFSQLKKSFTNKKPWIKNSFISFTIVVYGKNALWAAGGFFLCSTVSGHWEKSAARLSGGTQSSSHNTSIKLPDLQFTLATTSNTYLNLLQNCQLLSCIVGNVGTLLNRGGIAVGPEYILDSCIPFLYSFLHK